MSFNFSKPTIAFNEFGDGVVPDADSLFCQLGTRLAPTKALQYAVKCMGWAVVRKRRGSVDAVYDRKTVCHLALVGLLDYLWRQGLSVKLTETNDDCSAWLDLALLGNHLSELIEKRHGKQRLWRKETTIRRTPFASVLPCAMEIAHADVDDDTRERLFDSHFHGKYSMNKLDTSCGHYRVEYIGDGPAKFDPRFATRGFGDTYHTFIDNEYGQWLASAFAEMSTKTGIRVEEVSTNHSVDGPANYNRLLMPITRGVEKFLLVASDLSK